MFLEAESVVDLDGTTIGSYSNGIISITKSDKGVGAGVLVQDYIKSFKTGLQTDEDCRTNCISCIVTHSKIRRSKIG